MDRVSRGSGFGGAVRYIFSNFKASFLCSSNVLAARNEQRAISKMGMLAHRLRPDIKKPVWHQALRLPRGELISHQKYRAIADEYMLRMGWNSDKHQYIVIVSDDPDGQHIHIVSNRVGVDGSVFHGKNENLISTRVCQELERDFGLTVTKGPEYIVDERGIPRAVYAGPKDKKATKGEARMLERQQGEGKAKPLPRKALQRVLKSALAAGQAGGLAAFLETAEAGGLRVLANVASTGRVNGLSFETAGVPFKGSDLGDAYCWASLATTVRFDRSRDLALLEARSLRHVTGDQLPPLGQPATSTRQLPAPPAAGNPIVIPPAVKEAAIQRVQTKRRGDEKSGLEGAVERMLTALQYAKVASPRESIENVEDLPAPGTFMSEVTLGGHNADFVIGLRDRRRLALECKSSNSSINSRKRLNKEVCSDAAAWAEQFGNQVVTGAALRGVFEARYVLEAQATPLLIFWSHRLEDLREFIEAAR